MEALDAFCIGFFFFSTVTSYPGGFVLFYYFAGF
jgi:hypothetical protein